jgi:hypothetical protein
MRVRVGLLMDRDAVRACIGERPHLLGGSLDHEVHVQRAARRVDPLGDRACDERPDRDRRDEVAVHDVDVDHASAGRDHLFHLLAEPGKVGSQDRRRDSARPEELCDVGVLAHNGLSIDWPQCWQTMSSERLIRAIV